MAKIPFQDVVPPEKRSIRNISISRTRTHGHKPATRKSEVTIKREYAEIDHEEIRSAPVKIASHKTIDEPQEPQAGHYDYYQNREPKTKVPSRGGKKIVWSIATLVVVLGFIFTMMTVFSSATLSVVPKTEAREVSLEVRASKEKNSSSVGFEILKLTQSKTVEVKATGEEVAEEKAHGKITIYNDFSTEPQRLIVRTRFETKEGLIYRIPESITVPGKKTVNGVSTPGSIEVEVFADEAGEEYNLKQADFTVPGFKNDTARYQGFYARTNGAITGGFIGKRKTVVPEEKEVALQKLSEELRTSVSREFSSKVPEGLTLLEGSIMTEERELPQVENGSTVLFGKEVTAYALLINKEDLSKIIVSTYASNSIDWENIPAHIVDFDKLKITKKPNRIDSENTMNITVEGSVEIRAIVPTLDLEERLAGTKKADLSQNMAAFPGIVSMQTTIRPMWKKSFPGDPSKIKVVEYGLK